MRFAYLFGPAVLAAGLATLAFAVARGEANLYLVVLIPVVAGPGPLAFLGILLVFAGLFLTFLGWPARSQASVLPDPEDVRFPAEEARPPRPARRWGGVLFLGPLPLVFGSDPAMTRTMLWLGGLLFLALLALTLVALFA